MCDPITTAIGGMLIGKAANSLMPQPAKMPQAEAPPKPPAPALQPDTTLLTKRAQGLDVRALGTMLTGGSGVDMSTVPLGKNTLLGA